MNKKKLLYIILCFCFFTMSANAQVNEQESDSAKIYKDIHDLSKKSK